MRNISLIVFGLLFTLFLSCKKEESGVNQADYLIFGTFNGMCVGEMCVETYKLTDNQLSEDSIDDYSHLSFSFYPLGNDKFNSVKDLTSYLPDELLNSADSVFGCPDCADQGGYFIQLYENGKVKRWRVDNSRFSVPVYLHEFMDQIDAKMELIND